MFLESRPEHDAVGGHDVADRCRRPAAVIIEQRGRLGNGHVLEELLVGLRRMIRRVRRFGMEQQAERLVSLAVLQPGQRFISDHVVVVTLEPAPALESRFLVLRRPGNPFVLRFEHHGIDRHPLHLHHAVVIKPGRPREQVPFAEQRGFVPRRLQQLGERRLRPIEFLVEMGHAVLVGVFPGQHRRAGGRAERVRR